MEARSADWKTDYRKASLKSVMTVPSHEEDPSFYHDWLDPREYTTGDLGVGECAGENVLSRRIWTLR